MKWSSRRLGILLPLVFLIVLEAGYLIWSTLLVHTTVHVVTLEENGFTPEELTIRKGDTVIFKTTRNTPFWPASNLHPTHEIYPAFDARSPIDPRASWSFQFDKVGSWRFHDHLHANYTGVITVSDGKTVEVRPDTATLASGCINVQSNEKDKCWDILLEQTLKTNGMDAAFALFAQLYKTEPDIPKSCHGWGHILGKAAYELYKQKKLFSLPPETSYCGYGFYHGFMEKLLQNTKNIKESVEFCTYAKESLSGKTDAALVYANCIHGIGHGYTAWLFENPAMWGKFLEVSNKSLKLCDELFGTSDLLLECNSGVFVAMELNIYQNEYGFSYNEYLSKKDPFYYCKQMEERHRESCYAEFTGGLFVDIFAENLPAATRYAVEQVPAAYQPRVIHKVALGFMQYDIVKGDYTKNVAACRTVPERLRLFCFEGITNAFFQHGEPGKQVALATAFCQATYLTNQEKKYCENLVCQKADAKYKAQHCAQ